MTHRPLSMERLSELAQQKLTSITVVGTYADGATVEIEMPHGGEIKWHQPQPEYHFSRGPGEFDLPVADWSGPDQLRITPSHPGQLACLGGEYAAKMTFKERPLQIGDWVTVPSGPNDPAHITAIHESGDGRGRRISLHWPASGLASEHWFESEIKERIAEPAPTVAAKFAVGDIVLVPAKHLSNTGTPVAMKITKTEWNWEYGGFWRYTAQDRDGKRMPLSLSGPSVVGELTKLRQWPIRRGDFVQPNYLDEGRELWTWKVETVERNGEHPDEWFAQGVGPTGHAHSDGTRSLDLVDVKVTKTNRRQRVVSEYDEKWEVQS